MNRNIFNNHASTTGANRTLKNFPLKLLTLCFAFISGTTTAQAVTLNLVASGLDNPRDLTVGPDGALYVTEAGTGGDGACVPSPSVQGAEICYGPTGAVTKIENGMQQRVITGLPSLALPDGVEATGPQDIAFDLDGNAYVINGFAGDPTLRDTVVNIPDFGHLLTLDFDTNSWTRTADLAKYEEENNPDQGDLVSNPFSFVIDNGNALIIDSGANDILSVGLDGSNLTTNTIFESRPFENPIFPFPDGPPEISLQSVPTGIAISPDGTIYVVDFTGFPYPEGEARIYTLGLDNEPIFFADGFTNLIDIAFDSQNNLYVLEYSTESAWKNPPAPGSIIKITPDGKRTTIASVQGRSVTK
ncbi:MAG: ScyD/ScyE family protein [Moorea sp. SIO1F2]|uniref:ScyD/ScyE family protein n=1 Tax=Moorena sp. SIO1F2 TaxID=2607819 RepID=UPI0013BDE321|nr:ScyD/ScyE family protein [Moorena sp. SIO1F2]NET84128.1 ScyD/ScyE family protein [Moorena sp. SIO1F2]